MYKKRTIEQKIAEAIANAIMAVYAIFMSAIAVVTALIFPPMIGIMGYDHIIVGMMLIIVIGGIASWATDRYKAAVYKVLCKMQRRK